MQLIMIIPNYMLDKAIFKMNFAFAIKRQSKKSTNRQQCLFVPVMAAKTAALNVNVVIPVDRR